MGIVRLRHKLFQLNKGQQMETTTKPDMTNPHHVYLVAIAREIKDKLTRHDRNRRAAEGAKNE